MRRSEILLANDVLRGGHVLPEELSRCEDGRQQRRCPMRTAVVQVRLQFGSSEERSNPSIERASSSELRLPPAAAHLKRQTA